TRNALRCVIDSYPHISQIVSEEQSNHFYFSLYNRESQVLLLPLPSSSTLNSAFLTSKAKLSCQPVFLPV
ncbi:hypothetical protein KXS86_24490, partial [Salmonella enterica subsp. enterica serovar Weltevreden]|nr:hypothetical protein [Salmonella enterica subsp. enterica serovar Weltevreden]MCH6029820.1 hypothetical protein [Salmonella enterica]